MQLMNESAETGLCKWLLFKNVYTSRQADREGIQCLYFIQVITWKDQEKTAKGKWRFTPYNAHGGISSHAVYLSQFPEDIIFLQVGLHGERERNFLCTYFRDYVVSMLKWDIFREGAEIHTFNNFSSRGGFGMSSKWNEIGKREKRLKKTQR